jgi:predicted amidohydrolase
MSNSYSVISNNQQQARAKVAAVQMNSGSNVKTNMQTAEHYIAQAAAANVDFVVLPEVFACMPLDQHQRLAIAEVHGNGSIQSELSRWANKYEININAGSIYIKSDVEDKIYARSYFYNRDGLCAGYYDKIHLFDIWLNPKVNYKESAYTTPGDSPRIVEMEQLKIGASICYDLRFGYLYDYYGKELCDLITAPSAFTYETGQDHWMTLLKARALDSQSYIIAANQNGTHHNGRRSFGHSSIVSPWGEVIAQCKQDFGLAVATIDLRQPSQCRRKLPLQQHKRNLIHDTI